MDHKIIISDRPEKKPSATEARIQWARSLSDQEVGDLLHYQLTVSRAERASTISVLNELAHEIKFRLSKRGKRGEKEIADGS